VEEGDVNGAKNQRRTLKTIGIQQKGVLIRKTKKKTRVEKKAIYRGPTKLKKWTLGSKKKTV